MNLTSQMSRRAFVGTAAAGAAGVLLASCVEPDAPVNSLESATLKTRPSAPLESITAGYHNLGLDDNRDGFIYVPPTYSATKPAPLLVLLHGAGGSSSVFYAGAPSVADERGIVILAPDSAGRTWDRVRGAYGPDVPFIDAALALVFRKCNIKVSAMALGGFSDGASYALSLGISNGDLFPQIIAWSPGFAAPAGRRGTPRIFISHGINDTVLPIDLCSRKIVPALRAAGFPVQYEEFDGVHEIPSDVATHALDWFLPPAA